MNAGARCRCGMGYDTDGDGDCLMCAPRPSRSVPALEIPLWQRGMYPRPEDVPDVAVIAVLVNDPWLSMPDREVGLSVRTGVATRLPSGALGPWMFTEPPRAERVLAWMPLRFITEEPSA